MTISPTVRVVCLTCVLVCGATAYSEELVGDYGDFSRLQLQGLTRLDPESVLRGLRLDFPLCLGAHPLAKLDDLPKLLEARLLAGLQHAGHADADVHVEVDRTAGCLRAVVQEGPQYLCGTVEVKGVDAELGQRLIRRLTQPFPPQKAVTAITVQVDGKDTVRWLDKDGNDVTRRWRRRCRRRWKRPGKPACGIW